MTNCPNCGAPIDNYIYVKCPYCGTDYFDFATMDVDKPFWIKIKLRSGDFVLARVIMKSCCVTQRPELAYADNSILFRSISTDISLDMVTVDDFNSTAPGIRFISRKENEL